MRNVMFGQSYRITPVNYAALSGAEKQTVVRIVDGNEPITLSDAGRLGYEFDALLPGQSQPVPAKLLSNPNCWVSNLKPSHEGPDYLITGDELETYKALKALATKDYRTHCSHWTGAGRNEALAKLGESGLHKKAIELIEMLKDTPSEAAARQFRADLETYYVSEKDRILGEYPCVMPPSREVEEMLSSDDPQAVAFALKVLTEDL